MIIILLPVKRIMSTGNSKSGKKNKIPFLSYSPKDLQDLQDFSLKSVITVIKNKI